MISTEQTETWREVYDKYVGSLTPKEFIAPYSTFDNPIKEAIKEYLRDYPFEDTPPSDLADILYLYLNANSNNE